VFEVVAMGVVKVVGTRVAVAEDTVASKAVGPRTSKPTLMKLYWKTY
jgi:hypothetical protein